MLEIKGADLETAGRRTGRHARHGSTQEHGSTMQHENNWVAVQATSAASPARTRVLVQAGGGVNGAGDGAAGVHLSAHRVGARHTAVLRHHLQKEWWRCGGAVGSSPRKRLGRGTTVRVLCDDSPSQQLHCSSPQLHSCTRAAQCAAALPHQAVVLLDRRAALARPARVALVLLVALLVDGLIQVASLIGDAEASGILVHQAIPAALLLAGSRGHVQSVSGEGVVGKLREAAWTPHPAAAAAPSLAALQQRTWQLPASPQSITFCTDR